jgi:hypothetical protein
VRAATGLGIGVERIDVQPKPSASEARIADLRGSVARLAVRRGVRTSLETGRGPDGNRYSSRTRRAEPVLIPRPHAGH